MDALVEGMVPVIVEALRPAKIILFGSRARGEGGPDSDVDLLIVYDGELSKREVKLRVRRLLSDREFSLDVFVLGSDEYERQKKIVSTVGRAAAMQGVAYYG